MGLFGKHISRTSDKSIFFGRPKDSTYPEFKLPVVCFVFLINKVGFFHTKLQKKQKNIYSDPLEYIITNLMQNHTSFFNKVLTVYAWPKHKHIYEIHI